MNGYLRHGQRIAVAVGLQLVALGLWWVIWVKGQPSCTHRHVLHNLRMSDSNPQAGYYGVVAIGDGWKPVTPHRNELFLQDAIDAGATHIAYWTGRRWEHVEPVEEI